MIKADEDDTASGSGYTENAEGVARPINRNEITPDEATDTPSYKTIKHRHHL